MSQAGLHGLAGAYIAREWVKALLGPMYLFNAAEAVKMHRSFTHSLLTTAVVVGILWLVASAKRRDYLKGFALGLGGGILSHLVMDVLMWFSGIQWLWPLGYLGVPQELNIWTWVHPPRVVSNLLGAADYLFFGLYYLFLAGAARRLGTDQEFLGRLRAFTTLQWVFLAIYTVLAFFLGGLFDIAHYAAFILFFFPLCLYVTVKMRQTIWAL